MDLLSQLSMQVLGCFFGCSRGEVFGSVRCVVAGFRRVVMVSDHSYWGLCAEFRAFAFLAYSLGSSLGVSMLEVCLAEGLNRHGSLAGFL